MSQDGAERAARAELYGVAAWIVEDGRTRDTARRLALALRDTGSGAG
ncbi:MULTISPECIES: hypothetical protein [Streptomyces]